MGGLIREVRGAVRGLGRSPLFLGTALVTLAIAIGAGATAFSVLDAVRFRALPFRDAGRLIVIGEAAIEGEAPAGCSRNCTVTWETYADVLRGGRLQTLDAVAPYTSGGKAMRVGADAVVLSGGITTPVMFEMLGVRARLGRGFSEDDDRLGVPLVTVLSHDLWTRYFGADPGIIGQVVKLSDSEYTVVGVMPPGFRYEIETDFWLPAVPTLDPSTLPSIRSVSVIARLAPGRTIEQAASELGSIEIPGRGGAAPTRLVAMPLRERYTSSTQSHDLVFAAIVACILLIACANLANLVLVRTLSRRRDFAIRAAIGARVSRLTRSLLVENLILVGAGTVAGLLLAARLLHVLDTLPALASLRPDGMEYRLDGRVTVFAAVLAMSAAAILSLVPLRLIERTDVQRLLQGGSSGNTTGRRSQQFFVVAQIASAAVLLTGAALMTRTVSRLARVETGFDAEHVVAGTPSYPHPWRVEETYVPLSLRITEELRSLPGVASAAMRATVPLGVRGAPVELTPEGAAALERSLVPRSVSSISPAYFTTLGIRVVAGRAFEDRDRARTLPVGIVNEWAAERWWPGRDAVGRTVRVGSPDGILETITVVGVVADNRAASGNVLLADDGPELYRPYEQAPSAFPTFFVNAASAASIEKPVRELLVRDVPDRPLSTVLLADRVANQLAGVRTNAMQILVLALIGLFLSQLGVYGVLSWTAGRRTREIAIRGAIGATRGSIRAMVLRDAARLAAIGLVIGLPAATFAMRLIRDLLHGTDPGDPLVYAVVASMTLVVSLLASGIPAWRASRVDPLTALRADM